MTDNKMLQAILNGQSALRECFERRMDELESKVDDGFNKVNDRLDNLGLQIARLEDDTPTLEEFDELKTKVDKLQRN